MKKTTLTVVLLLSVICAFGQKKAARQAYNEALAVENPNFQEARTLISGALEHPESKDDAYTWYVAGVVENTIYDTDLAKKQLGQTLPNGDDDMYNAVINSHNYYLKAVELDALPNAKGKVKPKYTKKIKKALVQNLDGYNNAGIHYFNQKEYKKAYDAWGLYLDVTKLPYMQGEIGIPHDTILADVRYNRVLAAVYSNDSQLSIESLLDAKGDKGERQNTIYASLVTEYEKLRDTTNLISVLQEGEELFKNTLVETYDANGNPKVDANGNVVMQKENMYTI